MIELKSTGDQSDEAKAAEETVVLFKLDDVEYRVPARPRMNVALQYLADVRNMGEFMAELALVEKMAGKEAWEALSNHDDLTPEQFSAVNDYAVKLCLGALEATPKGNEDRGSQK